MEGDGTSEKKWPKFGVKNFDHVFLVTPSLFTDRELFFLILHIKNYPQNHSILSRSEVTYRVLIFTCRTLLWRYQMFAFVIKLLEYVKTSGNMKFLRFSTQEFRNLVF